jgi:alpha(1,3/1,4) fucosyltransferase
MFFSDFGTENMLYRNCKKIFFTGENQRPNFKKCDYSFTFDFDDYEGRNFRLPLWYFYIDWFNVKTYLNPEWLIPESYLYGENEFTQKSKDEFCSIVFGKMVDSRLNAIQKISEYKKVDIFGKANPEYNLPDGEKHKLDLISNYKFSLCYENSVTPGYHTEKLLHGKIAGNIPIYYGDKTVCRDFNQKCFINTVNMSDEEVIETIKEIDTNRELYDRINSEPLFENKISLEPLIKNLFKILK